MITSYKQAVEEMFEFFYLKWVVDSLTVLTYVPEIRVDGDGQVDNQDNEKFWCRFSQQTVTTQQSTFRSDTPKRYTTHGLIYIQIFCPKQQNSISVGRSLADIAKKIFQGHTTSDNIWFRNSRIRELDPEDLWYRFNIVSEYQYDEEGN